MNDLLPQRSYQHEGVNGPRVVWVVHRFTSGGIGPVCIYAARELARRYGWRTTVVALHEPGGTGDITGDSPCMTALDLPEHNTTGFLEWLEVNPQDVVITNDVETLAPCMPHFPNGQLHVIQVHDSGARYIDATTRNSDFADGVICVAGYFCGKVRDQLKKRGFTGPVTAIHNGANFPEARMRSAHEGPLRLLFMGRMDPLVKGTFDLAAILKAVSEAGCHCHLRIAGGFCERLDSRFKHLGLESLVEWVGRVPHEQCYELAAQSDLFMMTSRKEPFGMVTIESMSMGCVPVAWNIGSGTNEIIVPGESGLLVEVGNFKHFANAICTLDADRSRLTAMAHAATDRSRNRFTAGHMAADLEHFLGGLGPRSGRISVTGRPPASIARPTDSSGASRGLKGHLRDVVRRHLEERPKAAAWALKHIL